MRLRHAGAKCIIDYTNLDGQRAWLDGSRGRTSPFTRINSSRGLVGQAANVEFVCTGAQLTVVTLVDVAAGTELLASYEYRG